MVLGYWLGLNQNNVRCVKPSMSRRLPFILIAIKCKCTQGDQENQEFCPPELNEKPTSHVSVYYKWSLRPKACSRKSKVKSNLSDLVKKTVKQLFDVIENVGIH